MNSPSQYYTTDGSDPTSSTTRQEYDGRAIYVDRRAATPTPDGGSSFVLKAYTTGSSGKRDSDVATFEYVFADIPVPKGAVLTYNGHQQIGVDWSGFYTLEPVVEAGKPQATIDPDGNAIATDPGIYKVTAKLDPSSGATRWETDDAQGWSTDDQTMEFVITGEKDNSCTIAVYPDPDGAGTATIATAGSDPSDAGPHITVEKGTQVTTRATPSEGYVFSACR